MRGRWILLHMNDMGDTFLLQYPTGIGYNKVVCPVKNCGKRRNYRDSKGDMPCIQKNRENMVKGKALWLRFGLISGNLNA